MNFSHQLAALLEEAAQLLEGCPDEDVAEECAHKLRKAVTELVPQPFPTYPGQWYWAEWGKLFDVYKKPRGRYLYVTPPGGVEVRITPKIAGGWIAVPTAGQGVGDADAQRAADRVVGKSNGRRS